MKKLLYTLLISIGVLNQASAQSIYIEEEFVSGTGEASELIEVSNHIINNSGMTVDIRWERIEYNIPTGWDVPFCDKNNCYASFITTADFTLIQGETGLLKPVFTPDGIEGEGLISVRLYSLTPGITFEDTASFGAVTEGFSGVNNPAESSVIAIYPTITNDNISISASEDKPSFYSIVSADGRSAINISQLSWQSDVQNINVAPLASGQYFLLVYSKEKAILLSKPFIKL